MLLAAEMIIFIDAIKKGKVAATVASGRIFDIYILIALWIHDEAHTMSPRH